MMLLMMIAYRSRAGDHQRIWDGLIGCYDALFAGVSRKSGSINPKKSGKQGLRMRA